MTQAVWHKAMHAVESRMKWIGGIRIQLLITESRGRVLADIPHDADFIINEPFPDRNEAAKYYDEIEKHLFLALSNT